MEKRRLVMAGVVAGSVGIGALIGAVVFTPGIGVAASDAGTVSSVAGFCGRFLGSGPIEVAAETIGVESSELLAEIRDGATIAEVAEEHGVEPSAVIEAIVADERDRLDQAVENGVLTQEEADEHVADLEERVTDLVNGDLEMPIWGRAPLIGHPGVWGFADGPLVSAANAIGVEPSELLAELRDGATIAEVAEERGVDVSAVVDAIVASLQERLDAAVENGWITQDEADERAADLEEQATGIVNGDFDPLPLPGPWGRGHGPFGGWDEDEVATDVTDVSLY
jgi:uncharacterized protein (DUF433 family)